VLQQATNLLLRLGVQGECHGTYLAVLLLLATVLVESVDVRGVLLRITGVTRGDRFAKPEDLHVILCQSQLACTLLSLMKGCQALERRAGSWSKDKDKLNFKHRRSQDGRKDSLYGRRQG
jgi:hypothetical protein